MVTAALGLMAVLTALGLTIDWRSDHRLDRVGVPVEAQIVTANWEDTLTVRFLAPGSIEGRETQVVIDATEARSRFDAGQTVTVLVDPNDADQAKLKGEPYPAIPYYTTLCLIPLSIPLSLLTWRWRHMRRSERLAVSDAPSFTLLAQLRLPKISRRTKRAELALYPLDDPARSSKPLAVVPLIDVPPLAPDVLHPVEAKGQIRPYGLIVVKGPGWTAWPSATAR